MNSYPKYCAAVVQSVPVFATELVKGKMLQEEFSQKLLHSLSALGGGGNDTI